MKRYDLITPEGTKDILFEECQIRRDVKEKYRKIFSGLGYSEVVTPGIEFYDVFNKGSRKFPQESLYKSVDLKGRLVIFRPDSTIPIARMVATRLKNATLPLRLYYNQSIYSINPLLSGRSDEIVQAGVELLGSKSTKADIEVICTAIKALSTYQPDTFRLEIGDIRFFKKLVSKLNVDENISEEIRYLIEVKNYPALNDLLDNLEQSEITEALKKLPRMFGGEEVFEKASELVADEEIDKILSDLKTVYSKLKKAGFGDKILIDLGIVNRADYYTGLVFRGYLAGYGEVVLSGGRYDDLLSEFGADIPATGFAVNINAVVKLIMKNTAYTQPNVYAIVYAMDNYEIEALKYAQKLSDEGKIVINAVEDDFDSAKKFALSKKIDRIIKISDKVEEIILNGGRDHE